MGFLKHLKRLVGDESGNALAIGAASMPLLIGAAGMALDVVQISLAKRQLQRAADSAALAGAYAVNQSQAPGPAVDRDLAVNNEVPLTGEPVIENEPLSGPYSGNVRAVRVELTTTRALSFLSFFNSEPSTITVTATAAAIRDGEFCMLSLEDGDETGVTMTGNSTINIGCGISTNSRAATAISADGSSNITATPIMAVGGVPTSDNFNGSTLMPFSAVQTDPFESLPTPTPTNCRAAPDPPSHDPVTIDEESEGFNSADRSICFNGWSIDGPVALDFDEPTIIYINGGTLGFGSHADVSGDNVTFVLTSTNAVTNPSSVATVDANAQAKIAITAPETGPYAGVVFYQDRRAPLGRTIHFNGGADFAVQGAFYFPRSYFYFNGGAGMTASCIQLVARQLHFSGNGTITNDCDADSGVENFQGTFVRLVG